MSERVCADDVRAWLMLDQARVVWTSGPTRGMSVVQVTQACRTAAFVATPARRRPRMARARPLEGAQRSVLYFI